MPPKLPKKSREIPAGVKFLLAAVLLYLIFFFFNTSLAHDALIRTCGMFVKTVPILAVVFVVMVGMNLFIESGGIKKHLGEESGLRGWFSAIAAGILVSGPPYVLYPLLKDLKEAGAKDSLLAVFLYSRNVAIAFIPALIYYFGLGYVIVFSAYIVIFSVLNGLLVGWTLKKWK